MTFARSLNSFLSAVLRLGMAASLAVALVMPHFSMTVSVPAVSQAMDQMAAGHGAMSEMPSHHGKMNGSLCVTVCVGADRFSGPDEPRQSFSISPVFWVVTSAAYSTLYAPDPALRPPESAFNA